MIISTCFSSFQIFKKQQFFKFLPNTHILRIRMPRQLAYRLEKKGMKWFLSAISMIAYIEDPEEYTIKLAELGESRKFAIHTTNLKQLYFTYTINK